MQEECGSARRGWRPAGRSVPPPHPPVKDIRPDPARETESSARPMKSGPARPGPARPARPRSSRRRIGGRREGRRADHGGGGPPPWAPRTPIAGPTRGIRFWSNTGQILVKFILRIHTRGSCPQITYWSILVKDRSILVKNTGQVGQLPPPPGGSRSRRRAPCPPSPCELAGPSSSAPSAGQAEFLPVVDSLAGILSSAAAQLSLPHLDPAPPQAEHAIASKRSSATGIQGACARIRLGDFCPKLRTLCPQFRILSPLT